MSMPFYRWFPGDYARDTRFLSLTQHGAYRLLIDEYMNDGPLPHDLERLHRICGAMSVEERAAVEFVLVEFFVLRDGRWTHKRCDEERQHQIERSEKARGSSALAVAAKRQKRAVPAVPEPNGQPNGVPNGLPNQNQNQNQNQKRETSSLSHAPEGAEMDLPVALAIAARKAGVECSGSHQAIRELAAQGIAPETMTAACEEAKRLLPGKRVPVTYVLKILTTWAAAASALRAAGAKPPTKDNFDPDRFAARIAAMEAGNARV